MRSDPSFFFAITIGDANDEFDFRMIPRLSMFSISLLRFSLMAYGKGYGRDLTGLFLVSSILCLIMLVLPGISEKTPSYLDKVLISSCCVLVSSTPNLTSCTVSF